MGIWKLKTTKDQDAIVADPDVSYNSQADDTVCFSTVNGDFRPAQEMCEIVFKQREVLQEGNAEPIHPIKLSLSQKNGMHMIDETHKFCIGLLNYGTLVQFVLTSKKDESKIQIE